MVLDIRQRIAGKLRDLVAEPIAQGTHQATTLAIAASKGGVAKTTTAINLASSYARKGQRVLLIDLDPQAHVAACLRAHSPAGKGYLSDVLMGKLREVTEVVFPSGIANLTLAGSDKTLAETEMLLSTKIGKELLLDSALNATRSHFDVIILDCPPNLGTLTLNALCAADHLLIPCDMSILALEGVGDMLTAIDTLRTRLRRHIRVAGIVATRVDGRTTRMNSDIQNSFAELFGNTLLQTQIPLNSAVNKAHLAGKPVWDYAKRSPGAIAYDALSDELFGPLGLSTPSTESNVPTMANTDRPN